MAFLRVVKGAVPGQILELRGEQTVLGRHPNCQIVLDNAAVSRHHAQILESHGNYYLEDLHSRNHTLLNGTRIEGRTALGDGDTVRVCDVAFSFHVRMPAGAPLEPPPTVGPSRKTDPGTETLPDPDPVAVGPPDDPPIPEGSSIISTLDVQSGSSKIRAHVRPGDKLRAVMEISNALARTLNPEEMLGKVLEGLFKIHEQADAAFALLRDPAGGQVVTQASRFRKPEKAGDLRISTTFAATAMDRREAILAEDVLRDPQAGPDGSARRMRIRSMICAPLVGTDGRAFGAAQVLSLDPQHRFAQEDLDVLVSVCALVSLALENGQLHEQILSQREIQRDLEVATQIQLGFLPNRRPAAPGYEFYDFYEAAHSVGGDYFDYVALPDGRVAIAVADVAGKGIPAALLMARLYSAARFHLLTRPTAAEAMTGLNAEIASGGLGFRFITCALAVLDPAAHALTLASAGHQPPLHRTASGAVASLGGTVAGMPLGVAPNQTFREETVPLGPGDAVLFYTDGVTDTMNPADELYGSRLLERYVAGGPSGAEELVTGIVGDIERFSDGRPQRDDRCLVCVRRVE